MKVTRSSIYTDVTHVSLPFAQTRLPVRNVATRDALLLGRLFFGMVLESCKTFLYQNAALLLDT